MKDFAEIIGEPYVGRQKSKREIRDTTHGKPEKPANYVYGQKLSEWDSSLPVGSLSRDAFIRRVEPMRDRILVQLISTKQQGSITLTDPEPLIGGCRKAVVLKTGPGKRVPGEWWKRSKPLFLSMDDAETSKEISVPVVGSDWEWILGYRQPLSVQPGNVVLIGNWVDLEVEDVALCQEADIRVRL